MHTTHQYRIGSTIVTMTPAHAACTQGQSIDISICPTQLESGDDVRDGDLVVAAVRQYAERQYPGARVSVQIGFRQGHEWATVSGSADLGRSLMDGFWGSHADDEALFVGGAA